MTKQKPVTGNQPQVGQQKIYGSVPNKPIEGAANQPEVLPHVKVHGQRRTATVRVRAKDTDQEMVINQADFDSDRHERLEEI